MRVIVSLFLLEIFISSIASNPITGKGWEKVFSSNDWTPIIPLHRYGDKVYYMGTQFTATWQQASEFCERIHMTLLTIRSEEENDRIFKYIREASKGYQYWTGGSRMVDGFNWLWLAYGETIDYTKWSVGEPGNVNEKCLQLWFRRNNIEWNDRHCDTRLYFICERSKNEPGVGGTL